MLTAATIATGLAAALQMMSVGGGLYEFVVIDPKWPGRPDLVQPAQGGVSRKRFWIPAHVLFEAALIAALVAAWFQPGIRFWLLLALASHATMRVWSALDFIPKALAFEKAPAGAVSEAAARRWTRRSLLRMPLELIGAFAMLAAFAAAASAA